MVIPSFSTLRFVALSLRFLLTQPEKAPSPGRCSSPGCELQSLGGSLKVLMLRPRPRVLINRPQVGFRYWKQKSLQVRVESLLDL